MPMTRYVFPFLAALATALAAAAGPVAPRTDASARLNRTERGVIHLVNEIRAQNGLARVRASHALNRAAERHTRDMLARDFFDHSSSDGTPFDRRVRRYADARMVGETLAILRRRHGGAATVVRMWMESPPHRAVLLTRGFRRIGVARRWGRLGGAGQAVVTADFASGG
jgi:uncharacterized protein YkwD